METNIVEEDPAILLEGGSYNGTGEIVTVSWNELKNAGVGDYWEAKNTTGCARAETEETATVVYKNGRGVAVHHETTGTTDDPNPAEKKQEWLTWYSFHD